jgi:hypothetical protein
MWKLAFFLGLPGIIIALRAADLFRTGGARNAWLSGIFALALCSGASAAFLPGLLDPAKRQSSPTPNGFGPDWSCSGRRSRPDFCIRNLTTHSSALKEQGQKLK